MVMVPLTGGRSGISDASTTFTRRVMVLFTLKLIGSGLGAGTEGVPSAIWPTIPVSMLGAMGLFRTVGAAVVSGSAGLLPAVSVFDTWAITADAV